MSGCGRADQPLGSAAHGGRTIAIYSGSCFKVAVSWDMHAALCVRARWREYFYCKNRFNMRGKQLQEDDKARNKHIK